MMITADQADKAKQDRAPIIIRVAVIFMSLAILLVGLRLWCRRLVKSIGLDDIAAVMTLASIIGFGSAMIAMTHYGLGKHEWTVPGETVVLYLRSFWISILFYAMAHFWVKMTFLLQYYRIMAESNMRWVCLAVIIIVAMWGASQAILVCLQCIPLQAVWDPKIKGRCIADMTKWWYVNGVINIVSDFAIIVLPIPIVWKLNMPRSQKIILSSIFGAGFFTIAVSILRLQWLTPQDDMTWWNTTPASWSLAELFSAITCACLPTFKPLLAMIGTSFRRLGKGDSTDRLRRQSNPEDTELSESAVRVSSGPQIPPSIYKYGTHTHIVAS